LDRAFKAFKDLADRKKEVFDEDLMAIVTDEAAQGAIGYELEYLHVISGTGVVPSATVKLKKEGQVFQDSGVGDGPVDAVLNAIDATGSPLAPGTLELCRRSHAILFGAVGGPKWDGVAHERRPERGLLALRKELDLYANLRPAKCFPMLVDASPLKRSVVEGTDLMMIRELTGGLYFGEPRGIERVADGG